MFGKHDKPAAPVFQGFTKPNYTQTPNELFDVLMPDLSEAELKVLLYIVRRTFGFGKDADAISLNQMIEGITTREGERLDYGTGLSRSSVRRGVAGLLERGAIAVSQLKSEEGDYETNVYRLRFRDELGVVLSSNDPLLKFGQGVVPESNHRGFTVGQGVVPNSNLQKRVKQQKDEQETAFEDSIGNKPKMSYSATRIALQPYVADFARELNDQATLSSSLSRAVNLCELSGLDVDEFIDVMLAARAATQERSASIKKTAPGGGWEKKNKMPYFFEILAERLGVTEKRQAS